ncbi:MAG TPA: hypothetical protein VML75_13410 [Kofleriaceae bacterium]|nr:hypothetical protein [Kofleriaceae bacterium]
MSAPDTKLPSMISAGFLLLGLLIGVIGGLTSGSIAGGIVVGLGVIPALWGIVNGLQHKTQTAVLAPFLLLITNLGVAGLLIILRFVDWMR